MLSRPHCSALAVAAIAAMAATAIAAPGASTNETMPVRGIHLMAPKPADVPLLVRFIKEAMPKEGVNTLVLEVDYHFQFTKHPEVADADALSKDDVNTIVSAAHAAGVQVIPQINLLGHQSWAKTTFGLLRSHPELDETPGKYANNEGIYCRSYCPLHPALHPILFDLIDEVMQAFQSDVFHGGMDEVFILADEDCPRCRGKMTADVFAHEVVAVHDHLAASGKKLWIWGDRLIDGSTTGAGKWEGSFNGTWPAIDMIPKDVVINDWHYDSAIPTTAYFAVKGFGVVACPWRKADVAKAEVTQVQTLRQTANPEVASRMLGVMATTWMDSASFINVYFGEPAANKGVADAVESFKQTFAAVRGR